jgi:flagellar biosynthesis/type III secretory pathway chaperone
MLTVDTQVILNTLERSDIQRILERHHYRVYDYESEDEIRIRLHIYLEAGDITEKELSP